MQTYVSEPGFLAEVGSLAAHLEVRPALLLVLLRELGVAQAVVLVVGVEQIFNNSARLEKSAIVYLVTLTESTIYLPQRNIGIWVFDRWYTTIWIDAFVWFLLQNAEVHPLRLVRNAKLL